MGVGAGGLLAVALLVGGAILTAWLERRLVARRAEAGPATPVRIRHDVRPEADDPWMYRAGPVVAFLGTALAAVVLPLGDGWIGADVGIGLFYFIVVADFVVLGIALAGWGSNAPDAVEACYRVVAQLAAYVVPLGLAILGPIMMARSLSTVDIVQAQAEAGLWYAVAQPLGFGLYVVCALMQTFRAPFLEPFAATIDGGVLAFSGGWKGALWRLALSGLLFLAAGMGAVLFLGGPEGPWLPGPIWMAAKTFALVALLVWIGGRAPLLSTARTLELAWKVLIPLGLLNVLVVGGLILLGVGQPPE